MKLKNLALLMAPALLGLFSCEDAQEFLGMPEVSVDPSEVVFETYAADVKDITIRSTRDWKIDGAPEWMAVDPSNGTASSANQKVSITVMENDSFDRSAQLTLTNGLVKTRFTVKQAGTSGERPQGDGTLDKPFSVAEALDFTGKLAQGAESDKDIYISGIISAIKEQYTTNFGNGTFYISDDGKAANQFYIYRALYLNNKNFASGDTEIKEGDKVIICGRVTNYNGTLETAQKKAYIYKLNDATSTTGGNGGGSSTELTGEPKGTGTLADPFNPTGAIKYVSALAADTETSDNVYIKGKICTVSEAYTAQYGNGSFYISEDGADTSDKFYVFRALFFENKEWAVGNTQIKVGDEVIVCGKVVNYKGNTPETAQKKAYIYSLNGQTKDAEVQPGVPSGDGTEANPYNAAGANAYVKTLEADKVDTKDIYVAGKVAMIADQYSIAYGNASFYITEDGTTAKESFYVYHALYLGNKDWTTGNATLKVGDDVVVCGKTIYYQGKTPETSEKAAYLYKLNGSTEDSGSGETPVGNDITFDIANIGLANGAVLPSPLKIGVVTLTNDGGGNTNVPKYYTTGNAVRFYAKNTFTLASEGKNIIKVDLSFGESDGSNAINVSAGTLSGGEWTGDAKEVTFTIDGTSGHRRITKIVAHIAE